MNSEGKEWSQVKTKNELTKIRSKYIVQMIFEKMQLKAKLDFLKCNKEMQKCFNINIYNYKDYHEKYTPIEIEIIPSQKEEIKFINIVGDKRYYHIYFNNDNKEEIQRVYLKKEDKVATIKVIIDHQIISFSGLFMGCQCIKSINFIKFYRNNITNMSWMFYNCSSLKEINFNNFNTDNVKNMSGMFDGCTLLKELDLSKFNTYNVTNMKVMFSWCSSLEKINVSNFNTNNVTNMSFMFNECTSLKELNLSNFNTNNVKDMESMFFECLKLKKLNISNFNTNKVTNIKNMFMKCSKLEELNISNCSQETKQKIEREYNLLLLNNN